MAGGDIYIPGNVCRISSPEPSDNFAHTFSHVYYTYSYTVKRKIHTRTKFHELYGYLCVYIVSRKPSRDVEAFAKFLYIIHREYPVSRLPHWDVERTRHADYVYTFLIPRPTTLTHVEIYIYLYTNFHSPFYPSNFRPGIACRRVF